MGSEFDQAAFGDTEAPSRPSRYAPLTSHDNIVYSKPFAGWTANSVLATNPQLAVKAEYGATDVARFSYVDESGQKQFSGPMAFRMTKTRMCVVPKSNEEMFLTTTYAPVNAES
eukprot:gnl/TRDRNA2_/TRDRNA2_184963_c0_seq1.p1 gnl/TRDRNA2_/TRDRNA2_184963_c0~~gnl/TRDRNA2_/TRDRNA2_184963_c0_seq1.p1  ORF type:complete len:114 (+),score=15.46 gnl/TRDRNA2_/TRDRNA2_184963_c0_seq1:53-394(+)